MVERVRRLGARSGRHPLLDKGMKGWIARTAISNHWRVAAWYDLDDLIQDGYLCYAKCRKAYPFLEGDQPTDEDRRHFMALVKTSFERFITDLANRRTLTIEDTFCALGIEDAGAVNWVDVGALGNMEGMEAKARVMKAPEVIRRLGEALAQDVEGYRRIRTRMHQEANRLRRLKRPGRETRNQFFCRLLGLDSAEVDLEGQLKRFLSHA